MNLLSKSRFSSDTAVLRKKNEITDKHRPLAQRNEPRHEETNNVVSEQVRHKPSCTSTKDGWRLAILDLRNSRGIIRSV